MFKKIKNLILRFFWYSLPNLNSNNFFNPAKLLELLYKFSYDVSVFTLPFRYFIKNFFSDLKYLLNKYFNLI